jgi:ferredoxin
LVYQKNKTVNCSACHNTVESDTLNWNPNALDISLKYKKKSPADLSRVLLKPSGAKLTQSHKNFDLSSEDIVLLKAYMDKFTEIGLKKSKPIINNLLLFIIAVILFLVALIDLIITKYFKYRWINHTILFLTTVFITYNLVIAGLAIGRSKDYMPDQPIKFSHKVHAGQNGTECIYCHSSAPDSKSAGIPPVNVCMNCHLIVRNGTRSGSIEISKVIKAYDERLPIKWVKVYNLPDHVFFSHAQHVGAGGVDCQTCHGKVQENDVITQVTDLSMGWCIECHRTTKANFQGNLFYSDYKELAEKLKKGEIDSVTVDLIGGIECMKCHY